MQEEMEFTPDALQQIEPPEQAMIHNTEPVDKPVGCSEFLGYAAIMTLAFLTLFISWPVFHTITFITALCFIGFELFQLLIPPRLSLFRIGFICTLLFQSKLFLH